MVALAVTGWIGPNSQEPSTTQAQQEAAGQGTSQPGETPSTPVAATSAALAPSVAASVGAVGLVEAAGQPAPSVLLRTGESPQLREAVLSAVTSSSIVYPVAPATRAPAPAEAGGVQAVAPGVAPSGAPSAPSSSPHTADPVNLITRRTVAFGDSVAAGGACNCTPYPVQVGTRMGNTIGVSSQVSNFARGGYTSDDVVAQLSVASVRDTLAQADIVIVEIGANDMNVDPAYLDSDACRYSGQLNCNVAERAALRDNLSRIAGTIRSLNPVAVVAFAGYWNDGQDGRVGASNGPRYLTESRQLTALTNQITAEVAAAHGFLYVDLFPPFFGPDGSSDPAWLLAADGDHPNAAGHARIADAFVTRYQKG